jgi:hypothetical protein
MEINSLVSVEFQTAVSLLVLKMVEVEVVESQM